MPKTDATAEQRALVLDIDRVFAAPRELVWRLWKDPEHLVRWHGPEGCALSQCEQDFRPGGKWRRTMTAGLGHAHVIFGEFVEIDEPRRLSFTYTNASDGFETIVTMDFIAQPEGTTRMLFRQTPFINREERDGHGRGWNSSFDLLNAYLLLFGIEDWRPKGRPRIDGVAADFAAAEARHANEIEDKASEHRHLESR
ncbi:SRPBCC family protein [Hoeflea alexandrii]|uniref:SRPBCC family protein n=1 Tax=Hoeflea alexandrii TaxID=288436 RepID=UPI0022AEF489|nr:SRPBCC domain-containing protein [Hoeflea alexandrii]MCZ4289007.1 SRPBCC domain-containing protein [Hoeflea alexandrii]